MALVRAGENFNGTKAVAIASTKNSATMTLIADIMASFLLFDSTAIDLHFGSCMVAGYSFGCTAECIGLLVRVR
jgi:hypothetical protein